MTAERPTELFTTVLELVYSEEYEELLRAPKHREVSVRRPRAHTDEGE